MAPFGTKRAGVSPRDRQVAALVAAGNTYAEAAAALNVSERTVKRVMAKPAVRAEADAIVSDAVDRGLVLLCQGFTAAVQEMNRLVREGTADAVRLGAARAVIDSMMKVRENVALAREIAELRAAYESANTTGGGEEGGGGPPDESDDTGGTADEPGDGAGALGGEAGPLADEADPDGTAGSAAPGFETEREEYGGGG